MNPQPHIAQTSKGQIEYVHRGTGKPCLLLHGGHSNCFEEFGTEEIVAAGMSALIPSRPGYRQTPASAGETAEAAADAMIALLDSLSIATVSVVAASAGGPTALWLAANYPERIDKLVLESAVTKRWLTPEDELYKTAKRMFHPRIQTLTWGVLRIFLQLNPNLIIKQMIPSFSKLETATVLNAWSKDDKVRFKKMLLPMSSGHGFMLDIEHDVPTELLKKITAPTLIVHSQNDNSVAFEHSLHAQKNIDKAELFEAKMWGHLIWLGEGSNEVTEKVANFLREPLN